jgi:probable F420-dependent oxidoreductase
MKFGILTFPTDFSISPGELGQAVEALGFESLLFAEHTHIPVSRRSPWPIGGDLPEYYWHSLDPFVALGTVVSATERLLLGTGICLVVERDPITLAKEVASLDYLSKGRVLFGIGAGWNLEEMVHHGTDPTRRWKVMRERIEAMKTIWTRDEPAYQGEFVHFDPIWQWPKPVQQPHPPILIGGNGPNTLKRVVRYGDGWMPLGVMGGQVLTDFKERITTLNRMAADAGRGPIPVTITAVPPEPTILERHAEAGVERVLFSLPPAPADEVLPILKSYAEVAARFA